MTQWTFINDAFVPESEARLHFRDLAIQRGYGVFDFLKVIAHAPVFLDEHLERFYFSAAQMHLAVQQSPAELKDIIHTLLQKNGNAHGGIRITLTGGNSTDGYQIAQPNLVVSAHSFVPPSEEQIEKGIRLVTYQHQRQLPHVKTIDYLMAIWLQPLLKQQHADDVLYYHDDKISECPRSNFFMVAAGEKLVTPKNNILNGITRMKLLHMAKPYFDVEERDIHPDELATAKEAFITSTTKIILPVSHINGRLLGGTSRPVTAKLYRMLLQLQKGDFNIFLNKSDAV